MKRVLSIGQCGFDHGHIAAALRRAFGCEVDAAAGADDALRRIAAARPDLVLVNRVLDADGGDGLEVIGKLKADAAAAPLPVMLVSNYAEYQSQAAALGAVPGFGKAELAQTATLEKLRPFLG